MDRDLDQRISRLAEAAKMRAVAVVMHDHETGRKFARDGGRWFHAASTIKVAILLALYKLAESGRLRLDDTLHVRNRFQSAVNGEIFRVAASRDGDAEVHKRRGRSMRVRELARAMIVRSSNLATNLLLDYAGCATLQTVLDEAGLSGVRLVRGVEDEAAFAQGINNEITADGLVRMFDSLVDGDFLRKETRGQVIEILKAQEFNAMIPAGLPKEAEVAHKTGEISTACHDAGIVFWPERKPYVLAILCEAEGEGRTRAVADVSRAVYENLRGGGES